MPGPPAAIHFPSTPAPQPLTAQLPGHCASHAPPSWPSRPHGPHGLCAAADPPPTTTDAASPSARTAHQPARQPASQPPSHGSSRALACAAPTALTAPPAPSSSLARPLTHICVFMASPQISVGAWQLATPLLFLCGCVCVCVFLFLFLFAPACSCSSCHLGNSRLPLPLPPGTRSPPPPPPQSHPLRLAA
jgi:hypothetical protein